jgi:hypothetical protein
MKLAARIALIVGLSVMILLIVHEGAVGIIKLLSKAGWMLLLLLPLHVLPLLLDAVGWRAIIVARCKLLTLFLIAVVRQAVNGLLPVANIGGELVGIRLLARTGVDGTWAAASVIVEVLLTVIGQYLFVVLGVAFLLRITQAMRLTNELRDLGCLAFPWGVRRFLKCVDSRELDPGRSAISVHRAGWAWCAGAGTGSGGSRVGYRQRCRYRPFPREAVD